MRNSGWTVQSIIADPSGAFVKDAPLPGLAGRKAMPQQRFKIEMLATQDGRDDGPEDRVKRYFAGEVYEVGASLYRAFVDDIKCAKPARVAEPAPCELCGEPWPHEHTPEQIAAWEARQRLEGDGAPGAAVERKIEKPKETKPRRKGGAK